MADTLKWWQKRAIYQIYPRSFQDGNGDGMGDIPGIISRLDILEKLGAGALWLSPVYASPGEDNGYDISDYRAIDPAFGTMEDMERLIAEAKARNMKIIMDLVVNHTSTEHEWFQKSRRRIEPYTDYYIWRPALPGGKKPNNWTGFFGEDCWEWDEIRGEYYLHLFAKSQADLNYRCPAVLKEVKDILNFWLDKGVAGFRCDVINVLWKDSLASSRKKLILTGSEHYLSLDGTHEILHELQESVLAPRGAFTVGETALVTTEQGKKLCDPERGELDLIFYFEHMECDQIFVKWFCRPFNAAKFGRTLSKWQKALHWSANYLENHDQPRSVSRFGCDDKEFHDISAKMLCTLQCSLYGTPFIYQGQEIGMTNFDYPDMSSLQDVESFNIDRLLKKFGFSAASRWRKMQLKSRDNARTPMQWSAQQGAGFSSGKPWLAINNNYRDINVEAQMKDENSVWNYFRRMLSLRESTPALLEGEFNALETTKRLFAFTRGEGSDRLSVLCSFSREPQKTAYSGNVLFGNYERSSFDGVLKPFEAVILRSGDA